MLCAVRRLTVYDERRYIPHVQTTILKGGVSRGAVWKNLELALQIALLGLTPPCWGVPQGG
eukprot:4597549-Pyramimonas_sp.AAC.1